MKRLCLLLGLLPLWLAGCAESASIGVIGGADGPTAIYVTSQPATWLLWLLGAVLLLVLFFLWRKFRR